MPADEGVIKFFIEAIIASIELEKAATHGATSDVAELRSVVATMFDSLPYPDRIRHNPYRHQFVFGQKCLLLAPTHEDPPGIPVMSLAWDFTGDAPKTSVRVMIVYADPDDDDSPYRTWGFRWELPGDSAPHHHKYAHVQPISSLHLSAGRDPKSTTLSDRYPTFWLHSGLDRPDRLIAGVLVSLYGANQDLLSLLSQLDGAETALGELATG